MMLFSTCKAHSSYFQVFITAESLCNSNVITVQYVPPLLFLGLYKRLIFILCVSENAISKKYLYRRSLKHDLYLSLGFRVAVILHSFWQRQEIEDKKQHGYNQSTLARECMIIINKNCVIPREESSCRGDGRC